MFTSIYVDNYKSMVDVEIQLDELVLLSGSNGVGKTALLDVVQAVRGLLRGERKVTDPDVFPASSRTRWSDRLVQTVELRVMLGSDAYRYRLEVEHDPSVAKARVRLEHLLANERPLFRCELGNVQLYHDDHSEGPPFSTDWTESALARVAPRPDNRRLSLFLQFMRSVIVCSLEPRSFLPDSVAESSTIARDGHDFVSWYRHASQEHQHLIFDFVKAIQQVIPGLQGVRLESVGVDARSLKVAFAGMGDAGSRYELRLSELSDGQRALLALYALTSLTAGQGRCLFFDEPDNFVALDEIQPWLMRVREIAGVEVPQVVIASHHPELLDYLGPDAGVRLSRDENGTTTAQRLAELAPADGTRLSVQAARGWLP